MIRALLAIMAGLLCGVLGQRQAARIRARSAHLRRLEQLLQRLCLLLKSGALPLPEAFRQAADTASTADEFFRQFASALEEDPLTPLESHYAPEGPEGPALSRMLQGLSRGTLDSRVLAATQATEEVALLADEAASKSAPDARMWATLGWTCGACLTLMLI